MKPHPLHALTIGLDVVSAEGGLPEGAVRRAHNVVIQNNGNFHRRPGYQAPFIAIPGAHSFWRSQAQTSVFAAAGDMLYGIDPATGDYGVLMTGLPVDERVSFCDVGPDVYFSAPGAPLYRINPSNVITRPGIMDLVGSRPTLSAIAGTLTAGRYAVAYSVMAASGEESGLSSLSWIDVTTGGITVAGMASVPAATHTCLYVTTPNGDKLYRYAKVAVTATSSITDGLGADRNVEAKFQWCQQMPGGANVRLHKGRLYVVSADRKWVYFSEPLAYGVTDMRGGWMTAARTINVFEPVDGGIFVGLREQTLFWPGDRPSEFKQVLASAHGAFRGTGCGDLKADYFNPDVVPDRSSKVAGWCSEVGLVVGRADGSLAYPQAGRIRMTADEGSPLFMQQLGLKQSVFCLDTLTMGIGGAVDTTI